MDERQNQIKLSSFNKETRNRDSFKNTLLNIYIEEFEENIYLLFKLKDEFLNYLLEKINFNITEKYSIDVLTNSFFIKFNTEIKKKFLEKNFHPIKNFLTEKIENEYFQSNRHRALYKKYNGRIYSDQEDKNSKKGKIINNFEKDFFHPI